MARPKQKRKEKSVEYDETTEKSNTGAKREMKESSRNDTRRRKTGARNKASVKGVER